MFHIRMPPKSQEPKKTPEEKAAQLAAIKAQQKAAAAEAKAKKDAHKAKVAATNAAASNAVEKEAQRAREEAQTRVAAASAARLANAERKRVENAAKPKETELERDKKQFQELLDKLKKGLLTGEEQKLFDSLGTKLERGQTVPAGTARGMGSGFRGGASRRVKRTRKTKRC